MNRIKIFATLIVAIFTTTSCADFLERSAQNMVLPSTINQYKELLQGEGYFKQFSQYSYFINHMTDDIEWFDQQYEGVGTIPLSIKEYELSYKWSNEIENDAFTDGMYGYMYKQIYNANTCIDACLNNHKLEGSTDARNKLLGQAYFQKAYGYFVLANLYAQAYNEASPNDLCIPIVEDPVPSNRTFKRNTMKEVWTEIDSCITRSMRYLKPFDTPFVASQTRPRYEINYKGTLVLATRIYLFMEAYDRSIKYGEELMLLNGNLYNISNKGANSSDTRSKVFAGSASDDNFMYLNSTQREIVWMFDEGRRNINWATNFDYSSNREEYFRPSSQEVGNLIDTYKWKTTDGRRGFWFFNADASMYPTFTGTCQYLKYDYYDYTSSGGVYGYQSALRTGEVVISLAEAYARKASPDAVNSLLYLNKLRAARVKTHVAFTSADFASQEELVKFIWQERRRELCFEECHRWWDLRRTGQPELTHKFRGETYKLAKKDKAYILDFPIYERRYDDGLISNPRPVRTPSK